jgi:cell wall-associated NlpC family hydrolase
MRRTTFLSLTLFVGTLGLAAACSEQPSTPTAPAARVATITASEASAAVSPAAKPAPGPVGFTTVVTVKSQLVIVPAGDFKSANATCPDGTTVIGGGFEFSGYSVSNPAWVRFSKASPTGWTVAVINEAAGAVEADFYAYAYCAS